MVAKSISNQRLTIQLFFNVNLSTLNKRQANVGHTTFIKEKKTLNQR